MILSSGKYTCATAGPVVETEAAMHYRTPFRSYDHSVMSYTVPAAKYATLQSLNIAAHSFNRFSLAANALANGGLVYINDGVGDVFEASVQIDSLPNNLNSGEELVPYMQQRVFNFGDGIIIPGGNTIQVRVAQPSGVLGIRWTATLYGTTAGAPDIQFGSVLPITNTSRNIIAFAPAADYTILGMTIHAEAFGFLIGAYAVFLNGLNFYESPLTGMPDVQAMFGNETYTGPLSIPLEGIILREGDKLEVRAAPVTANDAVITAHLAGYETAISGGSGVFAAAYIGG